MSRLKSTWQASWTKLGLSRDLVISMVKNALPSTAAVWIIQSTTVGQQFDTVGYLPIIVTILMTPSLPRIPYLRLFIFTLLLIGIVLCLTLLAGYCSTQARLHTLGDNGSLADYNSSAAAVSGVWLVFTIWALQTYRTYNPQRAKSLVLCTIFAEVSILTSARLPDMESIIAFNIDLLEMFLLGFAFSAFTSLLIFPTTSRNVTSVDIKNLFSLARKAVTEQMPFTDASATEALSGPADPAGSHIAKLSRTFAKFQIDISDAKKDIGWSHFSPKNFNEIVFCFRVFMMPLRGLFNTEAIRDAFFNNMPPGFVAHLGESTENGHEEQRDSILQNLQEPMSQLGQIIADAIDHCCISIHVNGASSTTDNAKLNSITTDGQDAEKGANDLPGGTGFLQELEKRISQQRIVLHSPLTSLANYDIQSKSPTQEDSGQSGQKISRVPTSKSTLLFILYVEYLYNGVLDGLLELVMFCDGRYTTTQKRLQLPGKKRMLKVLRRLIDHHHVEADFEDLSSEIPNLKPQRSRTAASYLEKPKVGAIHRLNSYLDKPSKIFGSPQSFFGFRVVCAVMTVAIVAFLEQTQQWFFNQRALWAAVFIPFSMAPSSGEAKSLLVLRVLGSLLSIPISLVNWYIVNGAPAGVIVFYFMFAIIQQYFILKFPRWGSFWRPCLITYSIIIGYTLQARQSSVPQPPATINHVYPVYLIGPYRCLCTLVGVGVAYFWTVFPSATTSNQVMRQRLGQALFGLAEYHSCMYWAVSSWAGGHQGDMRDKNSIAHKLMKARYKLFVKETAILAVIRDQHNFAGYDITIGGTYPEHRYVTIADEIDRIMSYLNVVIFVSAQFQSQILHKSKEARKGPWEEGVDDLLTASRATHRELASLIHILASSVLNNQPLPPFLEAPESFAVARKMRAMRPELTDAKHANEDGYKAFAVMEVSVAMIIKGLGKILILVRDMVGEVGFDAQVDH